MALTQAQLEAQRTQLASQIDILNKGALDYSTMDIKSFLTATGETQMAAKKEIPSYSDKYNEVFNKVKDVEFTLAGDAATSRANDNAFYVYNPEVEAEKEATSFVNKVEQANSAYDAQQARFQSWIKTQEAGAKTRASELALQTYLNSFLEKNKDLTKGTVRIDASQMTRGSTEWNTWKSAKNRDTKWVTKKDAYGRSYKELQYTYKLSAEETKKRRDTAIAVETARYKEDTTLQTDAQRKLLNQLQDTLKGVDSSLAKLNRK